MKKRISILQPFIPHYRKDFFNRLCEKFDCRIYTYEKTNQETNFNITDDGTTPSRNYLPNPFVWVNPIKLTKHAEIVVLMLNFTHISTWFLLLTKIFHRKKIVLWGQGISVKRYLKEEITPDWKLRLMIQLSDGVWMYMPKEAEQWSKIFPKKKIVPLYNTLSGIEEMLNCNLTNKKEELKNRDQIKQEKILLFCARFDNPYRRVDLLEETIKQLDKNKFGFIIIGDGKNKPDFSKYENVYDFGSLYDTQKKQELFSIADIYFQPGWVGLSIVEAMAYGKPIFTIKRTEETKQCVEYSYIKNGENGRTFENLEDCLTFLQTVSNETLELMGSNAKEFVAKNLLPSQMFERATKLLEKL